jgi:hypothetical protein
MASRERSLIGLLALGAVVLAAAPARAGVEVGAEGAAPITLGIRDKGDGPMFLGQAALRWRARDGRLLVGVTVGQQFQSFRYSDRYGASSSQLNIVVPGLSVQYRFTPPEWDAYPYLGLDVGYAHAMLARYDTELVVSGGFYVAPTAGVAVPLGKHVVLTAALRYQRIRTAEKLLINETARTHYFGGLGLGGGLFLAF